MTSPTCRHCGYDLTGLKAVGDCPECGERFDINRVYHTPGKDQPVVRYLKPIIFAAVTVVVLLGGATLSMMHGKGLGGMLATFGVALLPALGTWVYWLEARQGE